MAFFTDGTVILDGGLATELEARGCDISGRALVRARAARRAPMPSSSCTTTTTWPERTVAITASYQASYEGFASIGIAAEETTRLLRRSVELARNRP